MSADADVAKALEPGPHEATLLVRASSHEGADALCKALAVEAGDPLGGADVRVAPVPDDRSAFTIHVTAMDLVHLRAAVNSFLKWLAAADDSLGASRLER